MDDERVVALVRTHLERYPAAELADVYKLLHQAAFGPGHAIASKKAAREWLEHDAGRVTPSTEEPLVEPVHPDGAIVRLHLRPYLASGGKIKPLLDAMVRSGDAVEGRPDLMAAWWNLFEELCRRGELCPETFSPREVRLFGAVRAAERWPAVHHSPAFHHHYHPVYRVLTEDEAATLCRKLGVAYPQATG